MSPTILPNPFCQFPILFFNFEKSDTYNLKLIIFAFCLFHVNLEFRLAQKKIFFSDLPLTNILRLYNWLFWLHSFYSMIFNWITKQPTTITTITTTRFSSINTVGLLDRFVCLDPAMMSLSGMINYAPLLAGESFMNMDVYFVRLFIWKKSRLIID